MTVTPHSRDRLMLVGSLGGGNFAKASAFPGWSKWQERSLIFRITGANLAYLLKQWPDAAWIGEADDARVAHLAEQEVGKKTALAKTKPLTSFRVTDYEFKREPRAHQARAFLLSRDLPAFGLFMEQGTGKTKVIIDTACWLYNRGLIDAMIVVAWPNGVHRNWNDYELPVDMTIPYLAEFWSSTDKTTKGRVRWRKWMLTKDRITVATFNVECFVSDFARELLLEMLTEKRCLFVIDQSASIKNHTAERSKFLINEASVLAPFRRIMDGAPVAEGAEELFSQFKFLDPNIIGHDTWTAFRQEFCEIGFYNEIKGYKNMEELRRRIDGYSLRVLSEECQDLPPRIYKAWPFDLHPEEGRIFRDLKNKELAFFDGTVDPDDEEDEEFSIDDHSHIEEHHALVKSLRLQQVSSGWWPKKDEFKAITKEPSRLKALLLLLEAAQGKAIIYARFRPDLELIQKALSKDAASYHGGISGDDKARAKRRFMEDPRLKYLIGQQSSLGIGHTLTAAKHVIFYCNHPSLRLREECEKRAHREGLKHKIIVWDLMARGTHDGKLVAALRAKKELASTILKDPQTFFLCHE